jgi:aspartyl-tRNA(Asn)/glutamyl-tRNA(Gln) amidotransferase subunit C
MADANAPTSALPPEPALTDEYVRKVAALSRLSLREDQVASYREKLSGILTYVQRIRELNLEGVEPLAHVGGEVNRLDADTPGPELPIEALKAMAPESVERFIKVPKVLGDGGGA